MSEERKKEVGERREAEKREEEVIQRHVSENSPEAATPMHGGRHRPEQLGSTQGMQEVGTTHGRRVSPPIFRS